VDGRGLCLVGFDYRGEPTPFTWPAVTSQYAIMDVCVFQDFLFLLSVLLGAIDHCFTFFHIGIGQARKARTLRVWCYSNCKQVELFLNGQSLGKKAMPPQTHLEWQVKYAPGTLSAVGYDNEWQK